MCWQIQKSDAAIEHTAVKYPSTNKSLFFNSLQNVQCNSSNVLITIMQGTI